jgi:dTDP-4-amino-4,6-dideoxygalactose transaminase
LIDFNKPVLTGQELEFIQDAFERSHVSGDGYYTRQCQAYLEEQLGVHKVLTTTNCTHALEMAAILADIRAGDEIIVPSFTFVSTVNAFVLRGATPVFIDIRPDTLNLDERLLESMITSRTKVILPVHYAGVGCEMDTILAIAKEHGLIVIEDNAHGLFGKYRGRDLGTVGALATQSCHETKNVSCGEGGALVINDPALIERAEIIREKGTNRSRFFRGMVDKYTWVDIGSSYLPSDILMAVLYAQLNNHQSIQAKRQQMWGRYHAALQGWAANRNIQLPHVPPHCQQSYHMYYILLPHLAARQALMAHLRQRDIISVFHYQPLHLSEMGKKFGAIQGNCPVTESVADNLLRLPFHNSLSEQDQDTVISALLEFTP